MPAGKRPDHRYPGGAFQFAGGKYRERRAARTREYHSVLRGMQYMAVREFERMRVSWGTVNCRESRGAGQS